MPEEYRQLLLSCNGGYVSGDVLFRPPHGSESEDDIGLLRVEGFRGRPDLSLEDFRDTVPGLDPRRYVWIINELAGNGIFIGVEGENRGRVYFWDHEGDEGAAVCLLANSFTEFVDGLVADKG